jgi:hypothetical protein
VRVQIWARRGMREDSDQGDDWMVLEEVEMELSRLRRWNGKVSHHSLASSRDISDMLHPMKQTFLPPNTILLSFSSNSSEFYYLPPPVSPTRPSLERNFSDGEIEVPTSTVRRKPRRKYAEWGDVGDAVERSLRETRMKKGIGFGELHRSVELLTLCPSSLTLELMPSGFFRTDSSIYKLCCRTRKSLLARSSRGWTA